MPRSRALLVASCSLLIACWRYHSVIGTCPKEKTQESLVDGTAGRRAGHEVHGRVVNRDSGEGLANARIDFGEPTQSVWTDREGFFVVVADTAGTYAVRVRRVGEARGIGTLRVTDVDSMLVAQLALRPVLVMLDGCGMVQVRERRPWWQWWIPPFRL